jgi:ABC-type glycerol-3-phosphate transport system substrate-binding protein
MLCPQAPPAGDDNGQTSFGQVLYSMGGTYLDAKGERAAFAGPQGIAALEYWVDLIQKRQVSPLPWLPKWIDDSTKGDLSVPGFNDGANQGTGMRLLLTASLKGVRQGATFKWGNVPAPQQPKLASPLSGGNWFVVKGTRRPDLATALLRHLADPEQLAMYAVSIQRLPTYKSVINHKLYQEFMKSVPELQVHWDMLQGAYPKVPNVVGWNDGQPALRAAIAAALRGEVTPSAALQDAARQMDTFLAGARTG